MNGNDCNSPNIKNENFGNSSIIVNAGNSSQNQLAKYLEMTEKKEETAVANGETEINDDNSSDDSTINGETFVDQTTNKIIKNDNDKNDDIDIEHDYTEEGHKQTPSEQVRIFYCIFMHKRT